MVGSLRVGQHVVEGRAVVALREAGGRDNVGVGHLSRLGRGIELAADVGELLAGEDVEVDLAVAEGVGHWAR